MATVRHTVSPESLQAAGKAAVRHDTVVSRRRRRHATAASSDVFRVPFGGRANGRVSTPPTPSATDGGPGAECADCIYGTDCAHCGPRFPPPPLICAETCNWASDADCDGGSPGSEFRPAPGRRQWTDQSSHVVRWQCASVLYITSLRTKVLKEELHTTETTNDKRGWESRR